VNRLRGDLLQMEQVIERRTAHIADINLQLALDAIHVRMGQLQCSIEALPIQTSLTSPDNSNQTLSPLPADTLRSAILPHPVSAPPFAPLRPSVISTKTTKRNLPRPPPSSTMQHSCLGETCRSSTPTLLCHGKITTGRQVPTVASPTNSSPTVLHTPNV
jgi:hypothetical protein